MKNSITWLGRLAVVCAVLLGGATRAETQISIGVSIPGVNIGINMPAYPQFERVPNYPVYYAPRAQTNFFFYDGLYWVYQQDNWYSSAWYDGPWYAVGPRAVPLYVLRIPVRYYRHPPPYFSGWRRDAPPRWGEHWGHDWERQRSGWDRWQRSAAPAPAPLPQYQRQYSGERYPRAEQQQHDLQGRNYRYQPRDAEVQQRYPQQALPAVVPSPRRAEQPAPRPQPPVQTERLQRPESRPVQRPEQARGPGPGQTQDQRPAPGQNKNDGKGKDKDKDRDDGDAPGQGRKK